MRKPTHIAGAIALTAALGYTAPDQLVVAAVGSLLPDVDHPKSALGKHNPLAPLFQHRGFFHSLAFVFLCGTVIMQFAPQYQISLVLGMLSHLLLDMLNVQGIRLLWPLKLHIRIPFIRIKTGSLCEYVVLAVLAGIAAYFAIQS